MVANKANRAKLRIDYTDIRQTHYNAPAHDDHIFTHSIAHRA
ncbi:MAG TPA: hypothetical protein VGM36_07325 [Rhizomicrobium sp.]